MQLKIFQFYPHGSGKQTLHSCENIERKICGPGFPKSAVQKIPYLSNTLRREVELNLYLLLRGRYQLLHLVPHYILIKISLLDKFDTQARCNFFLPPYILPPNYCIHTTSTRPFIPKCPTSNTRTTSSLLSILPNTHSPHLFFLLQKTKSSQFCNQFVENNTSKGEFQNFSKKPQLTPGWL